MVRPRRVRRFSAGAGQLCLEALPKQAGSRRSEKRGTFRQAKRPSSSGSNTGEPVFRSPEGSPKRGQAALPTAAGAWEARRATGYG